MDKQQSQFEQSQERVMTSQPNKRIWLYAIVGLIIAGGALGFYIWQKGELFPALTTPIPTITPNPSAGSGQAPTGWQTYRNEEYGFEFKYPGDWKLESSGNTVQLYTYQGEGSLIPRENDAKMEIRTNRVEEVFDKENFKQVSFGSNSALDITEDSTVGPGTTRTVYLGDSDGDYLPIAFFFNHELYRLTFNQILSTFRFIPSTNSGQVNQPIVTFEQCIAAGNPVQESFPEKCTTSDGVVFVNWQGAGQLCAQVITPTKNPETGEVRDFPTPCDTPEGWIKI